MKIYPIYIQFSVRFFERLIVKFTLFQNHPPAPPSRLHNFFSSSSSEIILIPTKQRVGRVVWAMFSSSVEKSSFLISQVSIDGVISRNLLLKWKFLKLCSLLLISQQWRDAEGFAFHGAALHNEIHQARVASVNADASGRHSLVRLSKLRKNSTE